ncbi:Uncharacterised protein [uncultured archaeon]|nr:Uncharacterised protein [uncultured archaeon]
MSKPKKAIELKKLIGFLCIFASVQFLLVMLYLESIIPGFDRAKNVISDLGVGSTALAFNSSIILTGAIVIILAFLFLKSSKKLLPFTALVVFGIAIACVGVFPTNIRAPHVTAAIITFVIGPLICIGSYWYSKKPQSYLFVLLWLISIIASISYQFSVLGGTGFGLLERIIVYPLLIWAIVFGIQMVIGKK